MVELFLNGIRRCVVLELDREESQTGSGVRVYMVVVGEFLHPLFERVRYEILHLLGSRARPCCGDRKDLDREVGIFRSPQLEIGEGSSDDDRDQEEERDRSLSDGQRGKVQAAFRVAILLKIGCLEFEFIHRIAALWSSTRTR